MIQERLAKLKDKMRQEKIDVYYITTSDYHMSEYIPEYFKVLRYFSNFSGSLGTLLVTQEKSYLFVDGRYHIQADDETKGSEVEVMKLGMKDVPDPVNFLGQHFAAATIGLDGKCASTEFVKTLIAHGHTIKSVDLVSSIMEDRAPLSEDLLYALEERYTGLSRKEKLDRVFYCLGDRSHIITNLESIAYLLNLRGNDIACTPVFLTYLVFYQKEVYLFLDTKRLSEALLTALYEDGVILRPYDSFYTFLATMKDEIVLLDETKVNYEAYCTLEKRNKLFHMRSIVEEMKSMKNPVEQENARMAHIYDGVAMVRFLKWLKEVDKKTITEYDAAEHLNHCRLGYKAFDLSFKPIVAYNENAAMMHYSPSKENSKPLDNEGILLVDSGGQYFEGTTDITRTIALGPVSDEIRKYYTLVLKSMFNLSEVVFKRGMSGYQLDILARKDLWALGVDYLCGTGHGVGQVLAVHETPPNIRYQKTVSGSEQMPLEVGHITSDEPGVYFEGRFGIRSENLLCCQKVMENEYGEFYGFETLTMCPFDLDLIDVTYLDEKTKNVLNEYHRVVYEKLSPYLNDEEKQFLAYQTRSLA